MKNISSKLPIPFFEKDDSPLKPNSKTDEEIEVLIKEMEMLIDENNRIEEETEKDGIDCK